MIPAKFDYVRPGSVDEAIRALAEGGDDAKVLVEHEQRLADRVHDGLGQDPAVFDLFERVWNAHDTPPSRQSLPRALCPRTGLSF